MSVGILLHKNGMLSDNALQTAAHDCWLHVGVFTGCMDSIAAFADARNAHIWLCTAVVVARLPVAGAQAIPWAKHALYEQDFGLLGATPHSLQQR